MLALGACVAATAQTTGNGNAVVELSGTPFFAQTAHQCGPAALATLLVASGSSTSPEVLAPAIYLPARKGSLQAEIIATTRAHARVPYVLRRDAQAVREELAAGNPVLILQNLGFPGLPRWHYAVVIGHDPADDTYLLRSGTQPRLKLSARRFLAVWRRADHWAMVVTRPERIPATADITSWLRAASAFEELKQPALAAKAYMAATARWPEQPLAWQALANARHGIGDLAGAGDALERALTLAPGAATLNNLAQLWLERGCPAAARATIARAEAAPDAAGITTTLARTRAGIDSVLLSDAAHCPP